MRKRFTSLGDEFLFIEENIRNIEATAAILDDRDCRFDRRGPVIRLSPHIYNDLEEARALGSTLLGQGLALV